MKAADLDHAVTLKRDLDATRRLAKRVESEALRLLVGDASASPGPHEVVLSAAYLARIRADLLEGFRRREAEIVAALAELGVEP